MNVIRTSNIQVWHANSCSLLQRMPDNFVDCVVCDPPYGLSDHTAPDIKKCLAAWLNNEAYTHRKAGMQGMVWDNFVPSPIVWEQLLRVVKPGGWLACFAGSRTQDLMGLSLRLAGWELKDCLMWLYGDGFTKNSFLQRKAQRSGRSQDVVEFAGFGSHLRPAYEPILLARKPPSGSAIQNAVDWQLGGLNIDACRIPFINDKDRPKASTSMGMTSMNQRNVEFGYQKHTYSDERGVAYEPHHKGRFPSNVVVEDNNEFLQQEFDRYGIRKSGKLKKGTLYRRKDGSTATVYQPPSGTVQQDSIGDSGTVARFFYHCKVRKQERQGMQHISIKPVALMEYLIKLVAGKPLHLRPIVLDPFAGTGTTGLAALRLGCRTILVEREAKYVRYIEQKLSDYL